MLRPALLALLLTGTATFCHAISAPSGVDEEDYSSPTLHLWHQAGPEGYLRLRFDHRGEALHRRGLWRLACVVVHGARALAIGRAGPLHWPATCLSKDEAPCTHLNPIS
jgi:hypothetical protein